MNKHLDRPGPIRPGEELPTERLACYLMSHLPGAAGPLVAIAATVRVERDSQKGIVIGRQGAVLQQAGTAARLELEALLGARVHLDLHVKVDADWQRRPSSLDRLGL